MSLRVIGLSGKAGVGKDYIAKHFLRPAGFLPIALADAVKELAVTQGRCTYEEAFVTKPPHARTALQQVGTEEGRMVWGEDCWCRALYARMRSLEMRWGITRFVVTDVRFPNEVHFIQDTMRGEVYRVWAPDRSAQAPLTDAQREHESETALDMFDVVPGTDRQFQTTVVTTRNGRQVEEALFDAVIDNRTKLEVPLASQLTLILRLHDHIKPDDVLVDLPDYANADL